MAKPKTVVIPDTAVYYAKRKQNIYVEKTLFPTRSQPTPKAKVALGGSPITKELAIELGNSIFGLTCAQWKSAWIKSGFTFRDPHTDLAYGMTSQKMELKGFIMSIQAYVLKQLLFENALKSDKIGAGRLIKLKEKDQEEILALAITDVLYKVTQDNRHVIICLPQENAYFQDDSDISEDGVTEKLHLFQFSRSDETQDFLRKYISIFLDKSGPGCLLFLYSLVLSKGFARLRNELGRDQEQLLTNHAESSQSLINLILTGRATPYTHNGTLAESDDDDTFQIKVGILDRSEIGLLVWHQNDQYGSLIGSRLKTPRLPIWVTKAGCHYGILFNPNRELTRDYHAERQFELYYYSSSRSQTKNGILNIDTRTVRSKQDRDIPMLEKVILTKWHEATITRNATTSFI